MKKSFLIFLCVILSFSCSSKIDKKEKLRNQSASEINAEIQKSREAMKLCLNDFVNNLSAEQKVSQLFLVNIVGCEKYIPTEHSGAIHGKYGTDKHLVPGGCLFFSYNIAKTPENMISFNNSILEFCKQNELVPPFLALDQEGGLVTRLRGLAGPLPSAQRVAENLSVEQAYNLYKLQAMQMKALGFHLNLAPVAEPTIEENKVFLGDRSFGEAEKVLNYCAASVNGFENIGIGTVLKHFPGNTNTDPHIGLPKITWTEEELDKNCFEIFSRLFLREPSGVLMSHALLSCYDNETPSCLSSYWVTDVLKNKLNYNGIVFSDDIFMNALQKNGFSLEKSAIMAINAGIDCLMLSEKKFAHIAKILLEEANKNPLFMEKIENSAKKIISWKIKQNIISFVYRDGSYKIEVVEQENLENRISSFLPALSENIEMYKTFFSLEK